MSYADSLNSKDHTISWQDAKAMIDAYNSQQQNLLGGGMAGDPAVLMDYESFNLSAVQSVINQGGASGFRIYTGMDTSNHMRSIFLATDATGQDIIMLNGACSLTQVCETGQRHP
ncbi:MAG: hypothetical protein H0X33_00940 [Taibaiella sp.]|nr:hypothetical protein [Taibaiella sp.]